MIVNSLKLINFRNYQHLELEFPDEGALFCGANGTGKTTILEAISLALLGKSPRNAQYKEMVNFKEQEAFVALGLKNRDNSYIQSIGFSKKKNVVIKRDNSILPSLIDLYGNNRFIYFGPKDISVVTGDPSTKRAYLDFIISQSDTVYLHSLITYKSLLKQKNSLLSSNNFDTILCDIYDQKISELIEIITKKRVQFFDFIKYELVNFYKKTTNSSSIIDLEFSCKLLDRNDYYDILIERRSSDRENGFSTFGPHRDNYKFTKDGKSITNFGSQGECRSTALSFKLIATHYLSQNGNLIIAVDDAFSDLDNERKKLFFSEIIDLGQIFLTVHSKNEAQRYNLKTFYIGE